MSTVRRANVPLYGCKVSIIVDENLEPIYEKLCKRFKEKFEPGNMEGAVITGDIDHYYLLLRSPLSHDAIGHELHHLVTNILKDRGITEEESSAWLSGCLNNLIYTTLESKKLYPFNGKSKS